MSNKLGRKSRKQPNLVLNPTRPRPLPTRPVLAPLPHNHQKRNGNPVIDAPQPPVQIVSYRHNYTGELLPLPELKSAPAGEIPQLVYQKLKQVARSCDFSDPNIDVISKETKKKAIMEIIDIVMNPKQFARLGRVHHQQIIDTFAQNVFRPFPNIPRAYLYNDTVTFEDSAWPHLSLMYMLFLRFLEANVEQRVLQYQLTPRYITNLFNLLNFPDERERVQAKNVILTIFNRVPPQRPLLRVMTTNLLISVGEGFNYYSASYLLELFYNFASGIPPPISPVLRYSFKKVVIPLHLSDRVFNFHVQLTQCMSLMIKKDTELTNDFILFIAHHWPITLDQKNELFINELLKVFEDVNLVMFKDSMLTLFHCVAFSAESPCTALADKALSFFNSQKVKEFIRDVPESVEILLPTLYRSARDHWQKTIQMNSMQTLRRVMNLSPEKFKIEVEKLKTYAETELERMNAKRRIWTEIIDIAKSKNSSMRDDILRKELAEFYTQR